MSRANLKRDAYLSVWVCLTLFLSGLGLSGCGATDEETTVQVVSGLGGMSAADMRRPVIVESFIAAPNAAELHAARVFRWGMFNYSDLSNIRSSVEDSLREVSRVRTLDQGRPVRLSVVVKKYIVASSNTGGAVLAAIDWCAAGSDGSRLYSELFYATNSVFLIGTLGGMKEKENKQIAERIVRSSVVLASDPGPGKPLPQSVSGTYDNLDEAIASVPAQMTSWGVAPPMPGVSGSSTLDVPWYSASAPASSSCEAVTSLSVAVPPS